MSARGSLHSIYFLLTLLWGVALILAAGPHGAPSTFAGDAANPIVWNPVEDPWGMDKAWHALLGMGFALPFMLWLETGPVERYATTILVVGVAAMGLVIEWRQMGAPGRQPSVTDALAFLVGGLVMLGFRTAIRRADRADTEARREEA